jgi:hypothetical protein
LIVVVAVVGLVVTASGCSLREVQLFFQIKGHPISTDQAKTIADSVNRNRPAGCDSRYAAGGAYATTCVPSNVTSVHCAGTTGDGPAVTGPLTVTGWDSFGLDPDGDKQACVDPVGDIDIMGQVLDQVEVAGWAFDPNTTDPINVDVYDNGVGVRSSASGWRYDVAAVFPSAGPYHGFDVQKAEARGTVHQVCAYAINVGAGGNVALPCKTITMLADSTKMLTNNDHVDGLIEGADRVPGGIHVRGFIVDEDAPASSLSAQLSAVGGPGVGVTSITDRPGRTRTDVAAAYGVPATNVLGFDFVQSTARTGNGFATASSVCVSVGPGPTIDAGSLMCRALDT